MLEIISVCPGDSLDLLIHVLQLKLEKFPPDDPFFHSFSEMRILPVITHQLDVLQAGEPTQEPFVGREAACSDVREYLVCREIQCADLSFPVHDAKP